ncbi:MAG: formate dehydrogenase subunit gamma [Betaproteobacteria bacterium]|nr:formate dehydrogenase subunit gamma [Betaproteobacteria bacterium]
MKKIAGVSLRALLAGAFLCSTLVAAQAPATPPPAAKAAPAATAPAAEAAKPAAPPALPAGSTAAVGWNNPPKWSEVETKPQYASVPGREMNILVEDKGHWWRAVRNGPVTFYGGIALLVVPVLLLLFFAIKGPFKLHDKPTGRLIERFNSVERMAHWTMAISFVVLAVTGIIILFGKYVLLPVLGASVFSWITIVGKNIHNFVGPLFLFSIVVFFFIYVKDNFFNGNDFAWLSKFGGLLSGNHVPSGRFNGGEKLWFWLGVVIFGTIVSVSGLLLLFPNWNTARELMAEANLFHAIGAIAFAAISLGHIYIGTIGTEGAYKGMREGYVDETWAKEHHALWYEEVKSGKSGGKVAGATQPAAGDD